MSVTVVGTIVPIPEHRDEVIAAIEESIATVHANDEGCELYSLHVGDDQLVMIEKWTTPELLQAHAANPALAANGKRLAGKLLSPPEVQVYRPHPAGTAEQGTL
jgi:quinol monooxygenase YgiN